MSHQKYYAPFESDEGSDTDVESDVESDTEDYRIRREQDPRYAIYRTAGPNFSTTKLQLQNTKNSYGEWDSNTDIVNYKDHVYLDPPKTIRTTLVSIKSVNRDKFVWPTPYNFQLKLPRVYKNVTKFQLVQMSFPNNAGNSSDANSLITSTIVRDFLIAGIPPSCIMSCISVLDCNPGPTTSALIEQGRLAYDNGPLLISLSIGSQYNSTKEMAQELTFKANSTPPFNLITYEDFRDAFMNTRDISLLFNEPGDHFHSKLTNIRYNAHTKNDIMNVYYSQIHIDSFPIITEKIAFNAYYYPILKEAIATNRAEPFIQTGHFTYSQIANLVLIHFDGLDSDTYYKICFLNKHTLDSYRKNHTFQYRNINKYIFSYNEHAQKSNIIHNTLHPSLQREFTNRLNMITLQQLGLARIDSHKFNQLKSRFAYDSAIYKHLEINLSSILGNYHFVTNYKYDGGFYHSTSQSTFHAISDLHQDDNFTSMFSYTSCIGGLYGNYVGEIMTFNSFLDYHKSLSTYHHIIQSTSIFMSSVNGKIYSNYHSYISTKYHNILPESMIKNKTYLTLQSVPVSFIPNQSVYIPGESYSPINNIPNSNTNVNSIIEPLTIPDSNTSKLMRTDDSGCGAICCSTIRNVINSWYSCLPTNLVINTLQYRLGLINILPNNFSLISTVVNITSTGNTNLFMQINEEQNFNNIDVTMPENYMITNDTTGQVKMFCAKILMGAVGQTGLSQTVIQNPSIFDTPLGKLDKLNIKIFYDNQTLTPAWLYQPFFLDITEWDATYQIDEEVGYANRQTGWGYKPTIPIPEDPNQMQFLGITHKNNPNNS